MKIAVLSDIHGNKMALEAVFNDIYQNKADHVIILGDLITDLPDETNCVLDLIKSSGSLVIKGNRELYLQNNHELLEYDQFLSTKLAVINLSEVNKHYIKSLPEQISLIFDSELSVRCTHGTPFKIDEHINENDNEAIVNCLSKINENILLCGHTHKQWYKRNIGKIVINPGSVGLNYSGDKTANYVIIKKNQTKFKLN